MTLPLILGHTTLEMTQVYMDLAESYIQVQHSKFSPMHRTGTWQTGHAVAGISAQQLTRVHARL